MSEFSVGDRVRVFGWRTNVRNVDGMIGVVTDDWGGPCVTVDFRFDDGIRLSYTIPYDKLRHPSKDDLEPSNG